MKHVDKRRHSIRNCNNLKKIDYVSNYSLKCDSNSHHLLYGNNEPI